MERSANMGKIPIFALMKCLLFAYILTGAFLLLLSFLLYKVGLSEKVVSIAVIVIYVATTFAAGFLAGKRMQSRRFLWGLLEGAAYFLILAAISLATGEQSNAIQSSFFTTLILCAGGGMLGGMVS